MQDILVLFKGELWKKYLLKKNSFHDLSHLYNKYYYIYEAADIINNLPKKTSAEGVYEYASFVKEVLTLKANKLLRSYGHGNCKAVM